MTSSELCRLSRRRTGLSQRGLAAASGISEATIAAVESGERATSMRVLTAVLVVAGLELSVDQLLPSPCVHLERYLRLALPARLDVALGGTGNLVHRRPPRWEQLLDLSYGGHLVLVGPGAVGLWVPGVAAPDRLAVLRRGRPVRWHRPPLEPTGFEVLDVDVLPPSAVHTGVGLTAVRVLPPAELALDPACATHRLSLRAAARVLETNRSRDDGGRRAYAHRDPDHADETERTRQARRYGSRLGPGPRELRSWRLDAPVSRRQQLRQWGLPD